MALSSCNNRRMDLPVTELNGVGEKVRTMLARLKIVTIGDLVNHLPRRYDDYSKMTPLKDVQPGPLTAKVVVDSVTARYVRRGLHITEAILSDTSGSVKAVWFNQPYRKKQLASNQEYFVSGTYEFNNRSYSLLNPSLEKVSDFPKNTARIVPVYKETKGLKSHALRKLIAQVNFSELGLDDESYPYEVDLDRTVALRMLHFPNTLAEIDTAREYFAFEELYAIILASALVRQQNEQFTAKPIPFSEQVVKNFVASLPFSLTNDQRRVAWQCLQELEQSKPMNRLIEGDVGSGKTVVAALLALNATEVGNQVAFMVPTEVLANQHYENISKLLPLGKIKIGLYTGSLKKSDKQELTKKISSGEINIVIGTHALMQDKLEFEDLNLVIIDEQHRFGVKQRVALVDKSNTLPHVLTMTATPIPRTLALTIFGDLDISVISEMPPGRIPVQTSIASPNSMQAVYRQIREEVSAGRQAFIIYPLVEDSEALAAKSATEAYTQLSQGPLKDLSLGLLHGRLKPEEKEAVMKKFSEGETQVLVSTTVVEVGVDVPNASIMVIEGAERFGLAQIHQLRGRVGRGLHQSYCILVPTSSQSVPKRLRALETINDGFRLAEYDLELRGPGAIYGSSQHGELNLNFTRLSDPKQIQKAQAAVRDFMQKGEDLLKYPRLAEVVEQYKSITHLN